MEYKVEVIFSDRRSVSLTVKNGSVIVRAPINTKKSFIDSFINKHSSWIAKSIEKERIRESRTDGLTEYDIKKIKEEARVYFEDKTKYFSEIMGLKYSRIKITSAKTRFGSCNTKGNISYSYRLMLYPEVAREYVVVHELAHLKEMNHSKAFYDIVEHYMPDYKERRKLLKQ